MSNASVSIKTFAQHESDRILHEITQKLGVMRELIEQTARIDAQVQELRAVYQYWSEVQAGIRDVEGNPVENSPRNAS